MLTHGQIWRAVDRLAERHGLSTSGLAKRAGLDPTTFNRSKRVTGDGRPRWPSTESIAKALSATGAGVEDFVALLDPAGRPDGFAERPTPMVGVLAPDGAGGRSIPLLGLAQANRSGAFDTAGRPASGAAWDEIVFPDVEDAHAFALEISGAALAPVYRDGDVVVVSPAAAVRRGDRVVVKTGDGALLVRELLRRTARQVELRALVPPHEARQVPVKDVVFLARIVWASQ
ncbi:helix-turn-helix transcriptional regulator [Xanthobacter sp. KR7-225]|uniref:S24 family peptidase n=1 Tax=Xanthobacter sp. KR7-225 TaxID=3156613 RepID=UPI0032B5D274